MVGGCSSRKTLWSKIVKKNCKLTCKCHPNRSDRWSPCEMFCEQGGKSVGPTAAYCWHCGALVVSADDADVVITAATMASSDAPCKTRSPVTSAPSTTSTPYDIPDPHRTFFLCGVYNKIKHRGQTVRVNQDLRPAVPRSSPALKCRYCPRTFDHLQAQGSHKCDCTLKNACSIQLDILSMSGPLLCPAIPEVPISGGSFDSAAVPHLQQSAVAVQH